MKAVVRNHSDLLRFADQVTNNLGMDFGKPYTVTLQKFKRPRSLDQNAKMHALFRELASELGYTEVELKEAMKQQFGVRKTVQVGGAAVSIPKGTSEYSVDEASFMIERIYQVAAECGVILGDANSEH